MNAMFNLRTRLAAGLRDELTASHTVLRHEAATCLHAMAAIGDGQRADVDRAINRFRSFLGLASRYCDGRRTLLWPVLEQQFPSVRADLVLLNSHSLALKSDLSAVDLALDELNAAHRLSHDDGTVVTRAALGTIRPAKILNDSLTLYLGGEELVLRDLLGGLSLEQIVLARRVLAL